MYERDHTPSADETAFKALDPVTRANLLLRLHHAWGRTAHHPRTSKHYDAIVDEVTWLAEDLKDAGIAALGTQLEGRTDRLRTIADSSKNGRRPMVQNRLDAYLSQGFRILRSWHESALSEPIRTIGDDHERYMLKQKFYYNTDLGLPYAYRGFMFMTADKGVRLKQFNDRDLEDLVTRTHSLLCDVARRVPHELPMWYLAAHSDTSKPASWQNLFASMQHSHLPTELMQAMLHFSPESGLVIESDTAKVMETLRHTVQRSSARA